MVDLGDQVSPIRDEILAKVAYRSHKLTTDELSVLKLRWGLESGTIMELAEVSRILAKPKESVRLLEKSAILKLKEHTE